ncbi:hypothetical protein PR048_010731 [Dryococelus australis]|uniref:PHD-type domain-containing protein n=1 Tax=Dryococelus australis TaxID=614101 RepID=A0ABQ9I4C3_9NEOP|nr:hypothetical protein PR048_010731 [Dryococelus australis]
MTTAQLNMKDAAKVLICCGCLGDRSDDANEIVECDGCGVTVHEGNTTVCVRVGETAYLVRQRVLNIFSDLQLQRPLDADTNQRVLPTAYWSTHPSSLVTQATSTTSPLVPGCYGVSDTASVSSTVSSCSTEPWFCEACRAGVTDPTCELCPNSGQQLRVRPEMVRPDFQCKLRIRTRYWNRVSTQSTALTRQGLKEREKLPLLASGRLHELSSALVTSIAKLNPKEQAQALRHLQDPMTPEILRDLFADPICTGPEEYPWWVVGYLSQPERPPTSAIAYFDPAILRPAPQPTAVGGLQLSYPPLDYASGRHVHVHVCVCEGGIFKETDVGKWVHLVCALYIPGVAFGEVDKLSSVTLFEMPYSKWGAKTCCLCEDERFARTGVCIGCDAGMCRTFFHVTCAHREGLLSETHSEEVDQADPFYAHCKMHTDKMLMKRRRRNWLALQLRTRQRQLDFQQDGHSNSAEQLRIQRKLAKYRQKYLNSKTSRVPPWVPTQKMPRLLTTSASACRKLMLKAELMGIDTQVLEMQEAQMAALADIRKKWHIQPAFRYMATLSLSGRSVEQEYFLVEFIGYYLDRNLRLSSMKRKLEELMDINQQLQEEHHAVRHKYEQVIKESAEVGRVNAGLKQVVGKYHTALSYISPSKSLANVDDLGKLPSPPQRSQHRHSVSTARHKTGEHAC